MQPASRQFGTVRAHQPQDMIKAQVSRGVKPVAWALILEAARSPTGTARSAPP